MTWLTNNWNIICRDWSQTCKVFSFASVDVSICKYFFCILQNILATLCIEPKNTFFSSKIKLKSRKNDLQLNPTACTPPEIRPKLGLSGQINEPWSGLYTFISKGSYTQLKGTSIAKTSILLCTFKGTVTMLPFSGYTGRLIPMDLPIGFAMIPKAKT